MPRATEADRALHVLTLTPFFPSEQNEVNGCFIAEPIEHLKQSGIDSSVIAVSPIISSKANESVGAGGLGAISTSAGKFRAGKRR